MKIKFTSKTCLVMLIVVVVLFTWLYVWVLHGLPLPEKIPLYFNTSPEYNYVSIVDIPEALRWATVLMEDKEFYTRNQRIDLVGVARGLSYTFYCSSHDCLGLKGATIPQRLAMNLMLISQQDASSVVRWNLRHFVLTLQITYRYTPDEILEFYFNSLHYVDQVYGVGAAAHYYYEKQVRNLDLAECAALSVIAQLPHFDVVSDFNEVKNRQLTVLDLMAENHYITLERAESAKREPIIFIRR